MAPVTLESGHTLRDLTDTEKKSADLFTGRSKTIKLEPQGWCVMKGYEIFADNLRNFKLYDDDVFVHTYPKSGTTWSLEVVWTLRNNPNLDNPAGAAPLASRCPIIDGDFCVAHLHKPQSLVDAVKGNFPDFKPEDGYFLKVCELIPRPRTIEIHSGIPLQPKDMATKAKLVYVIRDPRDVCLSYFHHCRVFAYEKFQGDLDQFIDAFTGGVDIWGPFWEHVKAGWELRNNPNVHIMFYGEMKNSPKQTYRKLADFLGASLTDEQLDKVIHFTSFAEMKKRDDHVLPKDDVLGYMDGDIMKKDGGFFRKGTSGGWKNALTQAQKDKFEVWINKNCPDMEIMRRINEA